jgi:hypothetical protein
MGQDSSETVVFNPEPIDGMTMTVATGFALGDWNVPDGSGGGDGSVSQRIRNGSLTRRRVGQRIAPQHRAPRLQPPRSTSNPARGTWGLRRSGWGNRIST